MARRVSWVNNSSGHTGTYVYRAATLDPQALPTPVATVDPVAQGATAEWIDNEAPYGCYAVQDFDGQGEGALSAEVCVTDPFAGVTTGDEIEGGIYAGINTESDNTQYHIIFAKDAGDLGPSGASRWKTSNSLTAGTDSDTDGWANTQAMVSAGISDHPAALHCVNYTGGGHNDWYLPSRNELALEVNLRGHPEVDVERARLRWASTQADATTAWQRRFSDGLETTAGNKIETTRRVRPVRRVPV